jgi:hypothetical protein
MLEPVRFAHAPTQSIGDACTEGTEFIIFLGFSEKDLDQIFEAEVVELHAEEWVSSPVFSRYPNLVAFLVIAPEWTVVRCCEEIQAVKPVYSGSAGRVKEDGLLALFDQTAGAPQTKTVFIVDGVDEEIILKGAMFTERGEEHQAAGGHGSFKPSGPDQDSR